MMALIDPTITLGSLLVALSTVVSVGLAAWKIMATLAEIQWRSDLMWKDYKKNHGINGKDHHEE